jgi:hypothetical protein
LDAKRYRSVLEGNDGRSETGIEDGIAVEMWGGGYLLSTGREGSRHTNIG